MRPAHRLAVALSIAFLWAAPACTASAADLYVARPGNDKQNDCALAALPCRSIAHAVEIAGPGDVINVASGKYRENILLDAPALLTLLGGWDATFTTRDPNGSRSVVRARPRKLAVGGMDRRVLLAVAEEGETIDLTIDGFVLTRGQARVLLTFVSGPLFPLQQDGGGGLAAHAAGGSVNLTVRRTAITENRSRISAGGGVFLGASRSGAISALFDRVDISANEAEYGAGIEMAAIGALGEPQPAVNVTLENCTVTDNLAEGSAAIFALGTSGQAVLSVESSTITGNTSKTEEEEYPEGAIVLNGSVAHIRNSILWGNVLEPPAAGADLLVGDSAVANLDHSDVGNAHADFWGTVNDLGGNLSVDPLLTGIHLTAASPAIDAASCTDAPSIDVDGDVRPSGTGCDIGADEYVP